MLTAGGPVLIMTAAGHAANEVEIASRRAQLAARGAVIEEVPAAKPTPAAEPGPGAEPGSASEPGRVVGAGSAAVTTRLSLPDVLDRLGKREVNELWVEAGARLAGALLQQALVDELVIYMAPKLLGPQARPLVAMGELRNLDAAPNFIVVETRQIGEDVRLRLRPQVIGGG